MAIKVAIEGYDQLEQIGVGGMAAVYRARKVSIDKIVAIKLLFPYLATDASYIDRFQREAKAAASIQHENVVNVIDYGESDGAFYIVMEYYDGRTLEQLMKERPGLPPEIAIRILLEVAYGLEAAHTIDIVHRDVKPANIIVTNQGAIKIADFGLARKSDSATMVTQQGKVVGTPAYMSPEQAAGRPVGTASDIFSFGVVAYELLSRRKPFDGQSYSDVLEKIQTFEPSRVGIVNPLITPELEALVKRCLEKNEGARYANAGELVVDLEAAMEKSQLSRDRRQLSAYVKDPEQYDAAFAEKTINESLSRGAFFMQKGRSHLEEAVLEYRRVLFLDPAHDRALANLDKLRVAQKGDGSRTVMIDAMPTAAPAAVKKRSKRRTQQAWLMTVGAGLIVLGGGAFWFFSHSRSGDGAAQQAALRAADPTALPSDAGKDSVLVAKTTPKKETVPGTMSASSSDPGATRITDTQTIATPKPAPKHNTTAKKEAVAKKEPAPIVEPGALSVYFLGGVGDVWVDGKLFARQPPFEKAAIAAGKHRIACRMSEDNQTHEVTVDIQPGHETVVEYEVGGKPVVTEE
jgi:predicted Ser/Thr protein kinase